VRFAGLPRGTGRRKRDSANSWIALGVVWAAALGCATAKSGPGPTGGEGMDVGLVPGPAPEVSAATTVSFAGARCTARACRCRESGRDDEETAPPAPGAKRFEIRISAAGGTASLDLSDLGTVATDPVSDREIGDGATCAYIDVPSGSTHNVLFAAKESTPGQGVAPRLQMAEYGPKGPFWYDLVAVSCNGREGRCDRDAANAWSAAARQRKRGRLDPCGSTVVTKLAWETSGGQAERAGGLFANFSVRFTMEVKKFLTQFAPGSTECLPK
jgi:hypothetical protein